MILKTKIAVFQFFHTTEIQLLYFKNNYHLVLINQYSSQIPPHLFERSLESIR